MARNTGPLSEPICGYSGTQCPKTFWDEDVIYVAIGVALLGIIAFAAIAFIIYLISDRQPSAGQRLEASIKEVGETLWRWL
ncbi:hypothetical protein KIN20_014432 [Parelaphostrongylus tenuis]|uniref:Uncharacterized protein n=1 Tax=Parelaphostrongylus tenuis TaxID=148309 RepID=A0AAD5MXD0_PARTN|nr:hypothetical protein KIN20_014432 [Parelaphostrongylus tenuis]